MGDVVCRFCGVPVIHVPDDGRGPWAARLDHDRWRGDRNPACSNPLSWTGAGSHHGHQIYPLVPPDLSPQAVEAWLNEE